MLCHYLYRHGVNINNHFNFLLAFLPLSPLFPSPLSSPSRSLQLLPVIDFFTTAANHVLGYGDDFLKAPDAVEIVPTADPLSETLKYSLFAANLNSVDVNIREKDSLLQLKVLWALSCVMWVWFGLVAIVTCG